MKDILDDELLEGPRSVYVVLRPSRIGRVIPPGDRPRFLELVELNCQIWGGAATPLLPLGVNKRVSRLYEQQLRGAPIDHIEGSKNDEFGSEEPLEPESVVRPGYLDQFAYVFLDEEKKDSYFPVTVPVLDPGDPWCLLYAACFGSLPERPSAELLHNNRLLDDLTFERFIGIERVNIVGSAGDLIGRLSDRSKTYPRAVSVNHLAYGQAPNTHIRTGESANKLPNPGFIAGDAGPNVLVVCTPGDVDDAALVWNLRSAHGDSYTVPLGLLRESIDNETIPTLFGIQHLCLQGIAATSLYVTSTSIPVEELERIVPIASNWQKSVAVVAPAELAVIGPPAGRPRSEVAVWSNGRATIVPVAPEDRNAIDLHGRSWSDLHLNVDVGVVDSPMPAGNDLRVGIGRKFFAGTLTTQVGSGYEGINVEWPSSLLMLKATCHPRNLVVSSSTAGIICTTLLDALDHIEDLYMFAHAPLLRLLQEMSQRQGTAWAKAHGRGDLAATGDYVAPHEDDLPEVDISQFSSVLGGIKGARAWLDWAEAHRFIVKGFPINCEKCTARQWVPVIGFSPPITCRGCARIIERPFPIDTVKFKYRLGESLRRVYEEDAMGHLLLLRYLHGLFGGSRSGALVGLHPGLDITRSGETARMGEADVLMLERDGSCIPAEVKRSFGGMNNDEVEKLDRITRALKSPWSIVAVTDFAKNVTDDFLLLEKRGSQPGAHRVLLTYDRLLDPHPFWALGTDPFEWKTVTDGEAEDREQGFLKRLKNRTDRSSGAWLEGDLLYRPQQSDSQTS